MSASEPMHALTSESETLIALERLINVVAQLRSPEGGCPWDLAQTPQTLIPYIIEEAYEVIDAIRKGESEAIAEELGDLLLQVVLQAQIGRESGHFTLTQIANGITEKLIRRHPHVFGELKIETVEEVRQNWEEIKAREKANSESDSETISPKLREYARQLPPLMAGMKISQKAAAVGFEWDNIQGVWEKFHEEVEEFKHAIEHESKANQQAELGDILFVIINLARWYGLDPEMALYETNHRFVQRFSLLESACDRPLSEYNLEEFERIWQAVKARLADKPTEPSS